MGKVLKIVAIAAAIAIAVFAPQIAGTILAALAIKSAIAVALLTTALVVGASLLAGALRKGAPGPSSQVGPPSVFRQSISNSFIVYGLRRVGGLLAFFHARKSGSDHFRYFVVAVAGHRCQGVVDWMLNDEVVTVDGSNMVTSGPYANAAWLWFQRGEASETANATFVSECDGKWTTDHKGNGVAAFYAKFKMTDAVVQAGMPNMTAVIEGRDEIRDPRDATTKYTRNATLVTYDFMEMSREEGGFGAYEDEIPDDDLLSAWANVCDETVDSEERYALDAVITTGAPPSEIRDVFVVNQAGAYTYSGGVHLIRPGYWVPVSEVLSEGDLSGAIQVSAFLGSDQAANEVSGTYIDPDAGYQGAPFATQALTPTPTDIRQLDLELAFVTSPKRAGRIGRIMLNRAQAEKNLVWPMNLEGLRVAALSTVQADTDRYGLNNYAWRVGKWDIAADFGIVLGLEEDGPHIYEEPTYVAPSAVAAIATAEVVRDKVEVQTILRSAYPRTLVLSSTDTGGGTANIIIGNFIMEFPGTAYGAVAITGTTLTGRANATLYYPYIDLDDVGASTGTFGTSTTYGGALNSASNPYRVFLNQQITTAAGGGGGTGGSGGGGGYGGGGPIP